MSDPHPVLAAYPLAGLPTAVYELGGAGGFSGARFWRVVTAWGTLCLRRWPREYPKARDLDFIHAVLRHVAHNGFDLAPVPLENSAGTTYLNDSGYLWEVTPWLPGKANFSEEPTEAKLVAAMKCLASFHRAGEEFRLPEATSHRTACPAVGPSPGIRTRAETLRGWLAGRARQLQEAIGRGSTWPEIQHRAERLLQLLPQSAPAVAENLAQFENCPLTLQPCLRDVWHDHVLFQGNVVTGLIDFGSLGVDNVSCDVARLLGSLAGDFTRFQQVGIEAYTAIRKLSEMELGLVEAFDRSGVLLGALNWAGWVLLERRDFEEPRAVLKRMDALMRRLESDSFFPPSERGFRL